MDMKQLEIFVTACERGSFSQAAACMYMTQPNISKSIRALEHELGRPLLIRNAKGVQPTAYGKTVLEMMNLLVGVSAPDDDTFVIEMSEPYYPMLTELACIRPFAMISPNCMIDGSTKDGVNGYIGTGPYVLTDFVTDEYAVFERNENYWGEKPAIQKITVKVIPDNQTRIMALENGEIDLIFGKNMLDADAISQYVDSDKFTVCLLYTSRCV